MKPDDSWNCTCKTGFKCARCEKKEFLEAQDEFNDCYNDHYLDDPQYDEDQLPLS